MRLWWWWAKRVDDCSAPRAHQVEKARLCMQVKHSLQKLLLVSADLTA